MHFNWLKIVIFAGFALAIPAFANPKPIMVVGISGGHSTCGDNTTNAMADQMAPFIDRARAQNYRVRFVVTCFTGQRPSEDMKYYSVDENGTSTPVQTIRGTKYFEQDFQQLFVQHFLGKVAPKDSKLIWAGQSHGGWVAMSVAASRPVDFLATLDPISRTLCNFKTVLSLAAVRRLKNGFCDEAALQSFVGAINRQMAKSGGTAVTLYETASMIHSGPLDLAGNANYDFGQFNPKYQAVNGRRDLNMKAHQALAVDPEAWGIVLEKLDKQMLAGDPDWRVAPRAQLADERQRNTAPSKKERRHY